MHGLLLYVRALLGALFLLSGTKALLSPAMEYQEFEEYLVPMWLFWPNTLIKFSAGFAIITGLFTRPAAVILAIFCTITAGVHVHMLQSTPLPPMPAGISTDTAALIIHLNEALIEGNIPHILKDLGLSAGMVLLALTGAGRFSLDQLFQTERLYPPFARKTVQANN